MAVKQKEAIMPIRDFLLLMLIMGAHIIPVYITTIRNPRKTRAAYATFTQQLAESGFNATKHIVNINYVPWLWRIGGWYLGIWVDYAQKKFAVKTTRYESDPIIYDFKALQSFEIVEGDGGIKFGRNVGQELARDITVRLTLKNPNGSINTVQIPLWLFGGIKGRMNAESALFIGVLECSRDVRDELNNIVQINSAD